MKLKINSSQIKKEYKFSYLISIPRSKGKYFYLSKKCCYPMGWWATIYLNPDYTYKCVSGDKLKNKFELSGEEVIEAMGKVNEQLSNDTVSVVNRNVPKKMEAKEVDVIDELKR